jgi:carbonic anhydrase
MSVTDELLENNTAYVASFGGALPLPPAKHVAVVACMDARGRRVGARESRSRSQAVVLTVTLERG